MLLLTYQTLSGQVWACLLCDDGLDKKRNLTYGSQKNKKKEKKRKEGKKKKNTKRQKDYLGFS